MIYRHEGRGIIESTKSKTSINAAGSIIDDIVRKKRETERAIAAAERQKKWREMNKCN
jgi:hypothetical protein